MSVNEDLPAFSCSDHGFCIEYVLITANATLSATVYIFPTQMIFRRVEMGPAQHDTGRYM